MKLLRPENKNIISTLNILIRDKCPKEGE